MTEHLISYHLTRKVSTCFFAFFKTFFPLFLCNSHRSGFASSLHCFATALLYYQRYRGLSTIKIKLLGTLFDTCFVFLYIAYYFPFLPHFVSCLNSFATAESQRVFLLYLLYIHYIEVRSLSIFIISYILLTKGMGLIIIEL